MRTRALALALALAPAGTHGQPREPTLQATRVDPALELLLRWRDRTQETHPLWAPSARFEREGALPVVVRFGTEPSAAMLGALAQGGVRWSRGARPYASGAYGAWADARGLAALAQEPAVTRVACDLPVAAPVPLERSAREVRADAAARAQRVGDGEAVDGRGVLIADLDSPVFVFHPAFFRADGGVVPWTDANGDGRFDPGVDGVDTNGDGRLSPDERLRVLRARERDGATSGGVFTPADDWLYLDTDGNGRRGWGGPLGLRAPAYGEPLFVVDDLDRDGRLGPAERLLRLGTSRFRAVVSAIDWRRDATDGPDLSQYDLSGLADAARMDHATAVCGILAGGVPGLSRRAGLAPGAELLVIDHRALTERTGVVGGVQRALDEGARVLLTEFAAYLGVTLDGSGELERELDAAVVDGALAVSPTGNLAASGKHLRVTLTPGTQRFTVRREASTEDPRGLFFSLHLRGSPRALRLELTPPDGAAVWVPTDAMAREFPGGLRSTGFRRRTDAGTEEWHVTVVAPERLPDGPWTLQLTSPEASEARAELYVGDSLNRWLEGYRFATNEPTTTLCNPSTAAGTIAVGAYVLGPASPSFGEAGDLAGYSSQGPRLDGVPGVSLAAPDSPVAPAPSLARTDEASVYRTFGGTSGAAPHVAAAGALLLQRFPSEPAAALRARLLRGARTDGAAREPDPARWGHGRLDLPGALGLADPGGAPPGVALRGPRRAAPGGRVTVLPEVTDDSPVGALRARWDLDYDGTWDTDWEPVAPRSLTAPRSTALAVKIEVRDGDGWRAQAAVRVEVGEGTPLDASVAEVGSASGPRMTQGCACGAGRGGGSWSFVVGLLPLRRRRR